MHEKALPTSFFCFCIWVFTKSKGKEKKEAKKPASEPTRGHTEPLGSRAMALAPKTSGAPETPMLPSASLALALKANMPKFNAMALVAVGAAPAKRPPAPSAATIFAIVVKTFV